MLTQDQLEMTGRLYRTLGSLTLVAEKLDITPAAVLYRLKKAGVARDGRLSSTPRPRQFVYVAKPAWTPADIWTPGEVQP